MVVSNLVASTLALRFSSICTHYCTINTTIMSKAPGTHSHSNRALFPIHYKVKHFPGVLSSLCAVFCVKGAPRACFIFDVAMVIRAISEERHVEVYSSSVYECVTCSMRTNRSRSFFQMYAKINNLWLNSYTRSLQLKKEKSLIKGLQANRSNFPWSSFTKTGLCMMLFTVKAQH